MQTLEFVQVYSVRFDVAVNLSLHYSKPKSPQRDKVSSVSVIFAYYSFLERYWILRICVGTQQRS
jgi:hypothetical protein